MMLLALACALTGAAPCPSFADSIPARSVYDGARGELDARIPRLDDPAVRVDGRLDEAAWGHAAVLTGFTQSTPAQGTPASERTEVLVFYTPRELFIGIRAHASDPSRIRSTLAERDQITADDHVRILLDTFHDRRRAFAFFVNPLGIQQDGTFAEGGNRGPNRGSGISFSPDFLFQSRGRLTGEGYEVEIRIPLKSLKFPAGAEQTWGLNVVRVIPARGAEESWAPRARNAPSELAQSGTLSGIHGLRPGRLLEINPTLTARREGATDEAGFRRGPAEPEVGGNLKYGITSELTLDATVNPDFSTVEADADQITVNERFALSVPEKRPFFLEGADLFSTPETLVYTRSIVDPAAGARITGKLGPLNLAWLGAVDDAPLRAPARYAPREGRAVVHVGRLRRDLGARGSTLGVLATSRQVGPAFNRVGAVDARIRLGAIHTFGALAGASWTRAWAPDPAGTDSAGAPGRRVGVATADRAGHIAHLFADRTSRHWGWVATLRDVPQGFASHTGFIRRTGVTDVSVYNRLSWFGARGARVERVDLRGGGSRLYGGRGFWRGDGALEGSGGMRVEAQLRGNHEVEVAVSRGFNTLDPAAYAGYAVPAPAGGMETGDALVAPDRRMAGLNGASLRLQSAYFKTVEGSFHAEVREVPLFAEGTRGRERTLRGSLELRPTASLRVDAGVRHSLLHRARDGSRYSRALVPRLRAEYQLTRALAVRALAQYAVEEVDVLRAPDGRPYLRDGEPFRVRRGNRPAWDQPQLNPVRMDVLLSWRPSPGTMAFLGYGREVVDDEAFRFNGLAPRTDGLFFKVSYLFRN
ncbi:MAG: carbohydrate binding family 9 domain-containing protein [Gemmatimonadetes bacterium]|nr:carbohydrate binding family 9 domain-containing protein [Gemmatimonadota bacterium]